MPFREELPHWPQSLTHTLVSVIISAYLLSRATELWEESLRRLIVAIVK